MKAKINGNLRTVFSITVMETETNKSNDTLRRWERTGVIPNATFRDRQGRRYYLKEEIEALAKLIIRHGLNTQGKVASEEFKQAVQKAWRFYRGR